MKKFLPLLLLAVSVSAAPDCNWSGRWSNRPTDQADNLVTFKTNGTTPVPGPTINNTATGCSAWIMIVDVEGFSAVSIELDTAPAASPGVAGTFSSSNLTTTSGSNPTTSTTVSTYLATGYYPFFRANVTTVTGTPGSINIQIFGWRSQAYLTAGSGGTAKGQSIYPCISSSGSSTTYTCTTGYSVTLAAGMLFMWYPDESCSGSPTLNIDGNGAVSIYSSSSATVPNALACYVYSTFKQFSPILLSYAASPGPALNIVNQPYNIYPPNFQQCGSSTSCAASSINNGKIVSGSAPLVSGTPSTATITGISPAFTSSTTYGCTVTAESAATGALLSVANVSGSSFTITGPATVTTVINYICVGY